ncbi:hypothetical protein Y032_0439g1499 [Ancylostoma ceylanicum]|uniref:Uncharacterized protein n=1 Tax=Ancylostoma ceylanicum TaxID=53326 RepID=A0A016X0S0_9BILA|nr:hypothetical protein Y032_0439g1499 [Ancylostoma ceylanicum]
MHSKFGLFEKIKNRKNSKFDYSKKFSNIPKYTTNHAKSGGAVQFNLLKCEVAWVKISDFNLPKGEVAWVKFSEFNLPKEALRVQLFTKNSNYNKDLCCPFLPLLKLSPIEHHPDFLSMKSQIVCDDAICDSQLQLLDGTLEIAQENEQI